MLSSSDRRQVNELNKGCDLLQQQFRKGAAFKGLSTVPKIPENVPFRENTQTLD